MKLSITQQLQIDIQQIPITEKDLQRAGMHVLDWFGCALAGSSSPAGRVYNALVSSRDSSQSSCTVVGLEGKHNDDWQNVVQHNAALGNVLEMDDVHRASILHPGPVVIPAALAIAESRQLSTTAFLTAVIRGYEMTMRIGERIGLSHYQYFHNTSTCGAFGAAMAAASLLELTAEQTTSALGNAGSRTGGVWQMRHESVMTKQWHNAEAARSGVMAALLAEQGLSGPAHILEGPQGIFHAMSNDADSSPINAITESSQRQWKIHHCSFKPWPACRHAHPAIDATLALIKQHDIQADDIQYIHVLSYKDATVFCDNSNPENTAQAKFSIQHAIAAACLYGEPQLSHYDKAVIDDKNVQRLRQRVHLGIDSEIDRCFPQHYGARVQIDRISGASESTYLRDTLGDPERPMNQQQIYQKLAKLADTVGISQAKVDLLTRFDWVKDQPIHLLSTQLRATMDHAL